MEPTLTIIEWKLLQWMAKPLDRGDYRSFLVGITKHQDGSESTQVYFHTFSPFTKEAERAALSLKERGWMEVDEFGNHRLNETGLAAAASTPKPEWKPPAPPAQLTKRELDVLSELEGACRDGSWVTAMFCGGSTSSHHAATLTKLVRCGYAEASKNGTILTKDTIIPEPRLEKRAKGSRKFRITVAGKRLLQGVK